MTAMTEHPRVGTGAAPGKVILFGEHAVVYGRPAVAAALGNGLGAVVEAGGAETVLHIPRWDQHIRLGAGSGGFESIRRAFTVALDLVGLEGDERHVAVTFDGELPPGVGVGSSAAFAVALLRALSDWRGEALSGAALLDAAEQVERVFHGTPSGLDHTVVTLGGCLRFRRGSPHEVTPISLQAPIRLVVAWAPREGSTREVVSRLRARRGAYPELYDALFDQMGALSDAGTTALATGDLDRLGTLFDLAHGLLNAAGVSNLANERMVAIARGAGALGAKLTGAGNGGAVIALPEGGDDASGRIIDALEEAGFQASDATLS